MGRKVGCGAGPLVAIVAAWWLAGATTAGAQGCLDWVPPLLHDTSGNAEASPSNPRIHGVETFYWGGDPWLVANNGNELLLWDISNPLQPTGPRASGLDGGYCGDRDYNLFNFSLCDDCRFGVAAFPSCSSFSLGAVLFDLGTGQDPSFGSSVQYPTAKARGALAFNHNGQEYLLINGVPDDSSLVPPIHLHLFNGIQPASLPTLRTVDAGGRDFLLDGGLYFSSGGRSFVYLFEPLPQLRVHIYELSGSGSNLALDYKGAPILAGHVHSKGFRIDAASRLAAAGRGDTLEIWDLDNPASPAMLASWVPEAGRQITSVAIAYPYLWAAEKGSPDAVWTYDISNPVAPAALDQAFWDPSESWNSFGFMVEHDGQFGPDGTTLYDGRYSVLEMISFAGCAPPAPLAALTLSPQPAFPGDVVTVTNVSTGNWSRSAVWITLGSNPQGQVVAGSTTLHAATPSQLEFTLPIGLALDQAYSAHVAVENDSHPFSWVAPGGQLKSLGIAVDRTPEVGIALTPAGGLISGDTVTLSASPVEGSPTGYQWTISPPLGPDTIAEGRTTAVVLSQKGGWGFQLVASYAHTAPGGGLYWSAASRSLAVSSVSAEISITPPAPVVAQPVLLDGTASRGPQGTQLEYQWSVAGATDYSGCPESAECVIPGGTLNPGLHQVTLAVTNPLDHETSVAAEELSVGQGSSGVDFSWSPPSPEIGELVLLTISGVPGGIEQATWSVAGPACPGYSPTTVCTPSTFVDCGSLPFRFAAGGNRTVDLTVRSLGLNHHASHVVPVRSTGTCPPVTCSYQVAPSQLVVGSAGATATVAVATDPWCSWTAQSNAPWISVLAGSSTDGPGEVLLEVAPNTGGSRTGTVTVADSTLTVDQAALSCEYALSPGIASVPAAGGTGTFSVQVDPGCPWSAVSSASWLRVTGGSSGNGPGTVRWDAASHTGDEGRTASIQIADQVFTVRQSSGYATADFSISNLSPRVGETVILTVTEGEPISWDMGTSSCDGRGPVLDCTGDPASCMSLTWAWAEPGLKTVRLSGSQGSKVRSVSVLASGECVPCAAAAPPVADLEVSPGRPEVGEAVVFTDASGGQASAWSWSVSLGPAPVASSSRRSFAHVFDQPGRYDVTLTSSNCRGSSATTAALTVGEPSEGGERVIAGAAHTEGLQGTVWRTDVALFNPSSEPIAVTVERLEEGVASGSTPVLALELAPGSTQLLEDILGVPPLGDGSSRKGLLRLRWEGRERPVAVSRTFNQTPGGSYGQYLPALDPLRSSGSQLLITGLVDSAALRSNLLLVNLDREAAAEVAVALEGPDGAPLASISGLTVAPSDSLQLVELARRAGIAADVDLYSVRIAHDGAILTAGASVIDNASGDPVQHMAAGGFPDRLWLPGLAHLAGANGSIWRSDVTLWNPGPETLVLTAELFPEDAPDATFDLRLELEPGAALRLEDVVTAMAGDGTELKGFLELTVDPASPGSPVVTARTFNLAESGTFGQAVPAFADSDLIPPGWRGCLPGVRGSSSTELGFRTNLGLVNTSPVEPSGLRLRLLDADGAELATVADYPIAPASSVQFNLLDAVGLGGTDLVGSAVVEVRSGGPVGAYLSVVDNLTQDPILVPATLCGQAAPLPR